MRRLLPTTIPDSVMAALQTAAANAAILALHFGTGVITARLLGPAGRGELAAVVMWPQFLAYALTLGLPTSLLYNLKAFPERGTQLFSASLIVATAVSAVAMLVGIILIPMWLTQYPHEVVHFAQSAMIAAPLILFGTSLICILLAREEFRAYNLVRILQPFSCLVALAILASTGLLTARSAAVSILFAQTPILIWMFGHLWSIYRPKVRGLTWASRTLTAYGARVYSADLLGTLATQIDRVLLVGLVDSHALGLYVVASNLSQVLSVVPTAVGSVAASKCCGRAPIEIVEHTGRGTRASIVATTLPAVGIALAGPYLLTSLYGPEYLDTVTIFRIFLVESALRGTVGVLFAAFIALGRPGLLSAVQFLGLLLSGPALLILVPSFGVEGAATAQLISTAGRFALVLILFPVALKLRAPRLWVNRSDLRELTRWFRSGESGARIPLSASD